MRYYVLNIEAAGCAADTELVVCIEDDLAPEHITGLRIIPERILGYYPLLVNRTKADIVGRGID